VEINLNYKSTSQKYLLFENKKKKKNHTVMFGFIFDLISWFFWWGSAISLATLFIPYLVQRYLFNEQNLKKKNIMQLGQLLLEHLLELVWQ